MVGQQLAPGDLLEQPRGQHHPAQPQRRGERLGDRARVYDTVGCQALHRPERRPVVAELGVVVVLDHHRARLGRPLEQRRPPPRRHRHPGGRLVRRRHQHRCQGRLGRGGGRERPELLHAGTVPVNRQRHEPRPVGGEDRAVHGQSRVLDRHRAPGQRRGDQPEGLGRPRADHDRLRVGRHAPHATQMPGQRAAQRGRTTRVRVAELPVGSLTQALPQRPQPCPAGKARQVGVTGEEVEPRRPPPLLGRGTLRCRRRARHEGARTRTRAQVPLGQQLRVGVDHEPPGHAQVGGQSPRGGQPAVRRQASAPNRVAKTVLELRPQRPPPPPVQLEQQLTSRIGTHIYTEIGPLRCTTSTIS